MLRWFSTVTAMLRGARVVLEHCLFTWLVVHRGFDGESEARDTRIENLRSTGVIGKLFEKKRLQYYFS